MKSKSTFTRREFLLASGLSTVAACLPNIAALATAAPTQANLAPGAQLDAAPVLVSQEIARALRDASVGVATNVPASFTSEIFEQFNALGNAANVYSFNEEAAYTVAHGASMVGKRATTIMKAHGLAKAANSIIDSLSAGVTAGLVAIVTDDRYGRHSDSIFDLQDLLKGMNIPYRVPSPETMYVDILASFAQSETLQLPVVVYVQSDLLATKVLPLPQAKLPAPPEYHRDPLQRVLCLLLTGYQREILELKLAGLDWRSVPRPNMPVLPDSLPPKWRPTVERYGPLFEAFKALRQEHDFVSGDTGISSLFAFDPFQCIDACTFYGGSTSLAVGAALAGRNHVWAVTGDYAFIAAGQLGLLEAVARNVPLKVLVIHNGMAQTTGGQAIPPAVYEQAMAGYAPAITHIANPLDRSEAQAVLSAARSADGLRIVVAEYV